MFAQHADPSPEDPCPEPDRRSCRYHVRAVVDPSVLSRVLELFVLRGLVPDRVRCERRADELSIELEIAGLAEHEAGNVARRLRTFPTVTSVLLQHL